MQQLHERVNLKTHSMKAIFYIILLHFYEFLNFFIKGCILIIFFVH
jgi:hypothetical protein